MLKTSTLEHTLIKQKKPSFQWGQVIYIHVVTMQLIRVIVLTRILKTEVIESIHGKKLGVKTEQLEFDPENLAVLAEI